MATTVLNNVENIKGKGYGKAKLEFWHKLKYEIEEELKRQVALSAPF